MKNYLKTLAEHGIEANDIELISQEMESRAKATGFSHPNGVYHALIVDLALSAVDIQRETQQEMGNTHTAKQWLDIITGTGSQSQSV